MQFPANRNFLEIFRRFYDVVFRVFHVHAHGEKREIIERSLAHSRCAFGITRRVRSNRAKGGIDPSTITGAIKLSGIVALPAAGGDAIKW